MSESIDPVACSIFEKASPYLDTPASSKLFRLRRRLPSLRRGFITPDPVLQSTYEQVRKLRRFPPSLCRGFQTPDPVSVSIPEDCECAEQDFPRTPNATELHQGVSLALQALANKNKEEDEGGDVDEDQEEIPSPLSPGRVSTWVNTKSAVTSSWEWKSPDSVLIIVDWDDTLFPTSWLWSRPWRDAFIRGSAAHIPQEDLQLLADFDHVARAFLLSASSLGQIVCITLSKQNWVSTCLELLPHLAKAWAELKIEVLYAREIKWKDQRLVGFGMFAAQRSLEEQHELGTWLKKKAMQFAIGRFYEASSWKNVLSIGDGCHEKCAMQDIRFSRVNSPSKRSACPKSFRAKTVQLSENPDCSSLMSELHTIQSCLPHLLSLDADFDCDMNEGDLWETHCSIVTTAET